MSWINGSAKWAIVACALSCCGVSAIAGVIVVRSNGPSAGAYPPGKALDPAGSVTLQNGDAVTVLDASGTRVLKGPGKLPVAATGGASASGISALLANTGQRQSRTGATRGANDSAPRPTNVWYIDTSRGGAVCVADTANLTLWRANYEEAGNLKVTRLADGKSAQVEFGIGQSLRTWPLAELPVAEGVSYRLEGAGTSGPTVIRIKLLPSAPGTLDGTAQILLAKDCNVQLDLVIQGTLQDQDN
jgi:hypothetical protein